MPLSGAAGWGNAVHEGSAVCPVPSSQVAGRASLQATTLKSLGLTGGSAIIRWGNLGLMLRGETGSEGKQGRVTEEMCPTVAFSPRSGALACPGACAMVAGWWGRGWQRLWGAAVGVVVARGGAVRPRQGALCRGHSPSASALSGLP